MKKIDYYNENGYVVYKNLISKTLINDFLKTYKKDFLSAKGNYPQMNTQKWGDINISSHGYLQDPIGDIHLINFINQDFGQFADKALKIICSDKIKQALSELDNKSNHSLMMSMFFDQNAGTPCHQDWYYLDSYPNGCLIAAWIALEDIDEKAGRFYVFPKSQRLFFQLEEKELNSPDYYEKKILDYIKEKNLKFSAPSLKKGDVLFWNSGTIHGSQDIINNKFSRKSITAHFIPREFQFVHNRYSNEIRNFKSFEYNNVDCRITSSIEETELSNKSRSLDTFGSQNIN